MNKQFTSALLSKIDEAASLAIHAKNPEITQLHLLWAIVADSSSCLVQVLNRKNISKDAIKQSLMNKAAALSQASNVNASNIRISQDLNNALSSALGAAKAAGDEFLSVDMYLRAEKNASVKEYLSDFIDPQELATELEAMRAGRKITDSEQKDNAKGVLEEFTYNLTAKAKAGKLDPITGRDAELERIMSVLLRKSKNNPILLGEPGVGKTAIVEALAQAIADGKAPASLANKQILVLNMSDLVAGTKYRGEFEERMSKLITEVKARPDAIIFIDEIHTILGAGGSDGSAGDAAQILKPALSRGEFCTIGATTLKEYKKYFEKDPALQRRFAPVMVAEPSVADAIAMMRGLRERLCAHHHVNISDQALVAAVKLSDKYIQGRFLPDKAIDLIDEACAELKMQIESKPAPLRVLANKIAHLETEKQALLMEHSEQNTERLKSLEIELEDAKEQERVLNARLENEQSVFNKSSELLEQIDKLSTEANLAKLKGDYAKAGELEYGRIPELKKELEEANKQWDELKQTGTLLKNEVDAQGVALVLERMCGIKAGAMLASEKERLAQMQAKISEQVIAQDEAVAAVCQAIKISKAGLLEDNKPIGSFLFAGATGVGKTELAKALARFLFDDEKALIRFDMNEYAEEFRISQLIGSSRGYVGSEQGGDLTEAVKNKPYSVLLFDEIEKAHPKIFNVFLNMLDEGALKDNAGNLISFKNTIIIFTSNAGVAEVAAAKKEGIDAKATLMQALKQYFKPEFLNRLSQIVCFNDLSAQDASKIAELMCDKLSARLAEQGLSLQLTQAAIEALVKLGFSEEFGARSLKRAIANYLQAPLSEAIIDNEFKKSAKVDASDGKLVFSYE